ncbi:MAG: hypothetical protein K2H34_03270, partial [Lachnospiraceae bacterium]|nr:hypothetical protein [Lachnospiraceae bacterium]
MKCLSNQNRTGFALMMIALICVSLLTGCGESYDTEELLHISSTVNLPIVRPAGLSAENVVIPYDAYVFDGSGMEFEAGLL